MTLGTETVKPAVAYTRLSKPNKKGRPGIGLAAQQAAIAAFARVEGYDLIGTRRDRNGRRTRRAATSTSSAG
jgi:hypothetical protein